MPLRRPWLLLSGALLLAACESTPTEPSAAPPELAAIEAVAGTMMATVAGPERLPEALRLTPEQQAAIADLSRQFMEATAADRAALEAVLREAHQARQNGATQAEVRAILREGAPIAARLELARRAHHAAVLALLTPEQRAWLEQQRERCDPRNAPPLTQEQRQQIAALHQQFVQANAADLATVRAAQAAAREARAAGASEAEIRAILEQARPAHERLAAAHRQLVTAVDALLTPEQRAARCDWRPGPGGPGGQGG